MRRIFIIAVAVFSAMVCHSCIHKEVKLEDKSILTAVELAIDNEAKEWKINTLRRIAVKFKPGDAIITDFSFEYPDDMFEFIPTREQYVYDVKALKEGKRSIMAVVNGVRSKESWSHLFRSSPYTARSQVQPLQERYPQR